MTGFPVRQAFHSDSAVELLAREVTALLAVAPSHRTILERLGIFTVQDLGASHLFGAAHDVIDEAYRPQVVAADLLDPGSSRLSPRELADSSPRVFRLVDDDVADALRDDIGIGTVRELAIWPPFVTARQIVADAYGATGSAGDDPERPAELVPVAQRYATERIQYDVLVFDSVIPSPSDESRLVDIGGAGGIDVGDLTEATLTTRPAIGAVVTYRQSWFPHGLALGQLLHSLALAPGESTRVAMIDWARRRRATTEEDTVQSEAITADVTRTRALSEITDAVAREAQSGFSESASAAVQRQRATSFGEASATVETKGLFGGAFSSLFGGDLGGPRTSSRGESSAIASNMGWASASSTSQGERSLNASLVQNVSDRTQQAASSTRNRMATTVVETSQSDSETLTTRAVTNYNHMHALTIQYFEVVQIYRTVLQLSDLTPCLFIPMKLVSFDIATVLRHRRALAGAGLIPDVRRLDVGYPDQLALTAPLRTEPWGGYNDANEFATVAHAIGPQFTSAPNDPVLTIPLGSGEVTLYGLDLNAEGLQNWVAAVELTLFSGRTVRFTPQATNASRGLWGLSFWSDFGAIPARDVALIEIVHADGENVVSPVRATLSFWVDGAYRPGDASDLAFTTVIAPRQRDRTPVFVFAPSAAVHRVVPHMNENALHYSTAVWRSMDASTVTTLLSRYTVAGRPLVEVVDPVPVAVTGNYLILRYPGMPRAESERLRSSIVGQSEGPIEDLVPLPSGGVFAEAVLGRSNSAEKLDITRFANWQDSPIPILPPEISPVSAGGRPQDPTPETGRLDSPVVTVVTPPALPDPAGLAPLYQALASGGMFRDMSGLAQAAQLTQAALQAAQAGATDATGAAGAAQQVAATQLTELLKLAAQVALTAATGGAGAAALGGLAVGGTGGRPGVANTLTNAGALINQGRAMDARNQAQMHGDPEASAGGPGAHLAPSVDGEWGSPQPPSAGTAGTPRTSNEDRGFLSALGQQSMPAHTPAGVQTAAHSFGGSLPGVVYEPIDVLLRIFIPAPVVAFPQDGGFLDTFVPASLYGLLGGDDRTFSPTEGTHRCALRFRFDPDPGAARPFGPEAVVREWGATRVYKPEDGEHVDGQPGWWWRLRDPKTAPTSQKSRQGADGVQVNARRLTADPMVWRIAMMIDAGIPLEGFKGAAAPAIDAQLNLDVRSRLTPGGLTARPEVHLWGTHDGFPAYELYINGRPLYRYSPENVPGSGPWNLFPPMDRRVSTTTSALSVEEGFRPVASFEDLAI